MQKKIKLVMIHGGKTFNDYKSYIRYLTEKKISLNKVPYWYDDYLDEKLGRKFEIIRLSLPARENAKYSEWKIIFEKYAQFFDSSTIIIGNSLGGTFLAKYLSENSLPVKIYSIFLVASPFDDTCINETLAKDFKLKPSLKLVESNSRNQYLVFSADDDIVPVSHATKYKEKLPHAVVNVYNGKNGHFRINEFPEILDNILSSVKNMKNLN